MSVIEREIDSGDPSAGEGRRANWSAIASDFPLNGAGSDSGMRISPKERDALIRSAGRNPADFHEPMPPPNIPRGQYTDDMDTGYGEFAERLMFNNMPDEEKIRYAVSMGGTQASGVDLLTRDLYERETKRDLDDLVYPEGDIEKISQGLAPGPFQVPREHVEELLKTPEGQASLRDTWTKTQTERVQYANSLEYQMFQAGAIQTDSAVLLADFRRLAEDTYGGKARAALNLGKDFVYGVANTGWDIAAGAAGYALDAASLLRPGAEFQALRPLGPMTAEEVERFENPPISQAREAVSQADEAMSDALYRAPARTGNSLYDKLAGPLASGAGSMVPFLASGGAPMWLRLAASTGAARQDVHQTVLEYGGSKENASLLSALIAPLSGLVEVIGFDQIFKAWRTTSPGGSLLRGGAVAALGEGGEETAQSLLSSTAGEIGLAMEGGYVFDPNRMWSAIGNAVKEGGYGAILGGGFGFAGADPVRTAVRHVDYRNFQRFIDGGIERLRRTPDIKKNTEAVKQSTHDAIRKAGAPESGYIDAGEFKRFFQDDLNRMRKAMVDLDVTQQALDSASEAGAQVEVSTSGLMNHVAANEQDAGLKDWVQPTPDAPTMAMLAQEAMVEAEAAAEFAKIREENEPLPDAFKIFRRQVMDAGYDAESAQYVTDVHYALARVAGNRLGITPEQYLDLNPVQIILAKGLNQVRSYQDIVSDMKSRAAQTAYTRNQRGVGRNPIFVASPEGGQDFGAINPEIAAKSGLKAIPVRLEETSAGFGKAHIESGHGNELRRNGFDTVESFVDYVVKNYDYVAKQTDGRPVLVARGERNNLLILELAEGDDSYYTVITGFVRGAGRKLPGRVAWDGRTTPPSNSGDSVRPLNGDSATTGEATRDGLDGQATTPDISTIPAEGDNVNRWNQEAVDNIIRQAGISPEQMEGFARFIQAVSGQEGDLSDAAALGNEFMGAIYAAEGLEQAAAGLERILANPGEITQAVFDAAGIEAATPQEGMAELRRRVTELNLRAREYREFYNKPETRRSTQAMAAVMSGAGLRGDVAIAPDVSIIRLFNGKQDRSTIIHELYHVYNAAMSKAAKAQGAPAQLADDLNVLNEAAKGDEEKAASLFEKYLSEGKAPSPGLADAFRRFRTWLTNIYRGVGEFAEIDLSPEVRGVFDRMLAADEEIGQARGYYHDIETLASPAGATPEQEAEIGVRAERARRTTEERQHAKVLREFLDAQGGRREIRNQARREVSGRRQYQSINEVRDNGGIAKQMATEIIGEAGAERIGYSHGNMYRAKPKLDDVALASLADKYGYASVENMLSDISAAPGYRDAVNQLYDRRIAEADAIVRQAMSENSATAVDEAYHNDDLSRAMAAKQAILDEQAKAQAENEGRRTHRQLTVQALKRIAYDTVDAKSGRKGGQYFMAVEAYRRHAEAAARADAAGDKITAAKEYQQVRLNHYIIQESIQAQKDIERFAKRNTSVNDWMRWLEGSKQHKDAPVIEAFRNTIKDVLTTWKVVASSRMKPDGDVGVTVSIPGPVDPEISSLAPSLAEYVAPWILNREGADKIRSWKDLTVGQIRELGDALDILTQQGRGEMRSLRQPGIETTNQAIANSMERMKKRDPRPAQYGRGGSRNTTGDNARNWIDGFLAKGLVPEYILAIADGNTNITGQGIGPLQNIARTFEQNLGEKSTLFLRDLKAIEQPMRTFREFSRRFKNIDRSALGPVPDGLRQAYDFNLEWDGEMAVMVGLNVGTANNLKAITHGYGMSEAQITQILSAMTSAELNALQQIWDVFETHFDEIDKVHYRLYNKHIQKEQAISRTVQAADGVEVELQGGYFPLLYDGVVDRDIGGTQDYEVNLNRAANNAVRGSPRMRKGMTIARVGAAKPPLLKLDAIAAHLDKTAHFIHMAEAVNEANAITSDKAWGDMFISRFGDTWHQAVRDYIKYVADPDSGNLGQNDIARRSLNWLRGRASMAALGFRIKSGLKQRLDTVPAILHMSLHSRTGASGFKYWLMGVRDIGFAANLGRMNENIQAIYEKSAFMRDTEGNPTADMRDLLKKARENTRSLNLAGREIRWDGVYNIAFMFMTSQDRAARAALWAGAYKMAMAGDGDFDVDALREKGMSGKEIDKLAVKFADSAAATFSATTAADLTAWQRDKGLMNMFSAFLTGTVRRTSRLYQYLDAYRQGQLSAPEFAEVFVADAAIQAWIPAFLAMGIGQALGDDDDNPTLGGIAFDVFFDPLLSFVDGVPFFNMATSAIRYKRGDVFIPSGINEFKRRFDSAVSIKKNITKEEWDKAGWKGAALLGYIGGVPLENIWRDSLPYLEAMGAVKSKKKKGKK